MIRCLRTGRSPRRRGSRRSRPRRHSSAGCSSAGAPPARCSSAGGPTTGCPPAGCPSPGWGRTLAAPGSTVRSGTTRRPTTTGTTIGGGFGPSGARPLAGGGRFAGCPTGGLRFSRPFGGGLPTGRWPPTAPFGRLWPARRSSGPNLITGSSRWISPGAANYRVFGGPWHASVPAVGTRLRPPTGGGAVREPTVR